MIRDILLTLGIVVATVLWGYVLWKWKRELREGREIRCILEILRDGEQSAVEIVAASRGVLTEGNVHAYLIALAGQGAIRASYHSGGRVLYALVSLDLRSRRRRV